MLYIAKNCNLLFIYLLQNTCQTYIHNCEKKILCSLIDHGQQQMKIHPEVTLLYKYELRYKMLF